MIAHLKRQFETTGGSDCYYIKNINFETSRYLWKNDRVAVT